MAFQRPDELDVQHIQEIDKLFVDPLHVGDVKLPGVMQAVDFHMLRHRIQRGFEHARFGMVQYLVQAILTVCMLTSPLSEQGTTWYAMSNVIIILCLAFAILEMAVYIVAYGWSREAGDDRSTVAAQRALAVFAVWSPPRLRQSATATSLMKRTKRGQERLPLFSSPGRVVEVLILLASVVGYCIPTWSSFSRLRYLHGLRSVKLLKAVAAVSETGAHLLDTLAHSLSMLVTAATFFAFFFVVFGVLGVDPFKGTMSKRCMGVDLVRHPQFNASAPGINFDDLCTPRSNLSCVKAIPESMCSTASNENFANPYVCGHPLVCRELDPPNLGYTSFNNIGNAWLTMLQITSLSGWSDLLYAMWAATPRVGAGLYCFLLIIVVSFILLNLVTAVVSSSYTKTWRRETRKRNALGRRSFIAVELERLTHWNFPASVVHHLSFERDVKRPQGDGAGPGVAGSTHATERVPFYKSTKYNLGSDFILAFVVAINAANDSKRDPAFRDVVWTIEVVYAIVFSVEFLLSLLASGSISKYGRSKLRVYDALCLVLTFVGLSVRINLSVLRSIRFVRWVGVFPFVRGILARVQKILPPTIGISVLLGLYVVVFAAASVRLYSQDYVNTRSQSVGTRSSSIELDSSITYFNDETTALGTMFRFVTVDGWQDPMYVTMAQFHWIVGIVFFVPVYLLFGLVLTSLFISVIIDAFDPTKEEKLAVQRRQAELDRQNRTRSGRAMINAVLESFSFDADADIGELAESQLMLADQSAKTSDKPQSDAAAAALDQAVADAPSEGTDDVKVLRFRSAVDDASFGCFGMNNKLRKLLIRLTVELDSSEKKAHDRKLAWERDHQKGYGLFEPGDKAGELRHKAWEAEPPKMYGQFFAWAIMLFVVGSCVQVFLDPPLEACSNREREFSSMSKNLFLAFDILFVVMFAIEALFKMIALSCVFAGDDRPWYLGPTYFKDGWNILDFLLLVVMVVAFFVPEARPLRILRTLRPLRVIRRVQHMRHMITGLLTSMPSIIVVFALAMYIIFVGAVVGVNMFSRKMYYCTQDTVGGMQVISNHDCRGVSFNAEGVPSPNSWRRPAAHFDHVGGGIMFITEIASLSEWTDRMQQVVDVVGTHMQPRANNNQLYSVFFVILVIALSLVATQIIVGVLMYHFDAHRGVLLLTDPQKDWVTLRAEIKALAPIPPPPETLFKKLQPLVSHPYFETVVNVAVFLNIVLLATTHHNQSDTWSAIQFWGNVFFLAFFFVEFLLKVMALSLTYFKSSWNLLDFTVLVGSIIEFTIEIASGNQGSAIVSVARTFRMLRVFRSVKRIPNLRNVFHTLALSFFSIVSVAVFIIIVLFIFGAIGRNIFGNIRQLEFLNRNANFRDLDVVFFLMFRLLTLDRWATVMSDMVAYYPPYCNRKQPGWWYIDPETGEREECGILDDCSSESSQIFFIFFYAVAGYLVISVMVAMLLENFKLISTQTRVAVKMRDFDSYQRCWLRARRPLRVPFNYEDYIEPRLLSAFVIDLFNHRNALVVNDEGMLIHPVLSARSRINFRKLKFELDALGKHQRRAPEQRYTFHSILLVLTRMQLGLDVLTAKQREARKYFDMACTIAVAGDRLRKYLIPLLAQARRRVASRRVESMFGDVVAENGTDQGSDVEDDGEASPTAHLRRQERLRRPGSRVGFDLGDRGDGPTPSDDVTASSAQVSSPATPSRTGPMRRKRSESDVVTDVDGAPRVTLTTPSTHTSLRMASSSPGRTSASESEIETPAVTATAGLFPEDASGSTDHQKQQPPGDISFGPPLATSHTALDGRRDHSSGSSSAKFDSTPDSREPTRRLERATENPLQRNRPPPLLRPGGGSTPGGTPSFAPGLEPASGSSAGGASRSASPASMSRNQSVSQNELRAALSARAMQSSAGVEPLAARATDATHEPARPRPLPGNALVAADGATDAPRERQHTDVPSSDPLTAPVDDVEMISSPMHAHRRQARGDRSGALDRTNPAVIEGAGTAPLRQPSPAMLVLQRREAERRVRKQREFVDKVWGATRRFIETVEDGVRAALAAEWRDMLWRFRAVPRRRYGGTSPERLGPRAPTFEAIANEPFSTPLRRESTTRHQAPVPHTGAPRNARRNTEPFVPPHSVHREHPPAAEQAIANPIAAGSAFVPTHFDGQQHRPVRAADERNHPQPRHRYQRAGQRVQQQPPAVVDYSGEPVVEEVIEILDD